MESQKPWGFTKGRSLAAVFQKAVECWESVGFDMISHTREE